MPSVRQPRSGSMQFWPRKRARRIVPRIRTHPQGKTLNGFAGYKVGMTHVIATETSKHSPNKGNEITIPVTIIEVPPMKIAAVRLYNKAAKTEVAVLDDKDKPKELKLDLKDVTDVRAVMRTQPQLTTIGKKAPEEFELGLGGSIEEKVAFIKENLGKDISISQVFEEGELADIKSVTKGKGFQGPVKRFGISIRQAKSEKSIRNPGSLGPWKSQGHIMYRVAHAGKMGFHQRTEYHKQILSISSDIKAVTPKGGFVSYGNIKNQYILVRGSVGGPKKRLIILMKTQRKKQKALPTIEQVSNSEKQGI